MPKCKYCKARYTRAKFRSSFENWCSERCRALLATAKFEKMVADKKRLSSPREYNKTDVKHQKELTQKAINKLIRLLDRHKPCISCQNTNDVKYDAGHFKTVASRSQLRYNPRNEHKQCSWSCNVNKSGNVVEYRKGLINRYGEWIVNYLEMHHEPINYTIELLADLKKWANKRARDVEKGAAVSREDVYSEYDEIISRHTT